MTFFTESQVLPERDYLASFAATRKLLLSDLEAVWPHVDCMSLEQLERMAPATSGAPKLGEQREEITT